MHDVFISLGSNIGDRYNALLNARNLMTPDIVPVSFSKIYETPPWGYEDQPPFLNQVIKAQTELSPSALLERLKGIEKEIGRKSNFKYGPRLIDLDILFYDELIYKTDNLTVPHPEIINRAFVLIPLMDIASNFIHPFYNQTISNLAKAVEPNGIIEYRGQNE
ncbi:MAG: 2-amino-4-hydroxy-6-hydroxymethyldihydropteridine diphosphokinase [Pelolinea sp.]|nr:2-amino-4-hydroxy-6-hydroxymethyldihydropteridine diphosphokinase [Pelolinea sp.]